VFSTDVEKNYFLAFFYSPTFISAKKAVSGAAYISPVNLRSNSKTNFSKTGRLAPTGFDLNHFVHAESGCEFCGDETAS
jgi:hypothetical protein